MITAGEIVNSSGRYQLIEHPQVGGHTIGWDLIGGRSMFQDVAKNRAVAAVARLVETQQSMTCPDWSIARYRFGRPSILRH